MPKKKQNPIVIDPNLLKVLTEQYNLGNDCVYNPITNSFTIKVYEPTSHPLTALFGLPNSKT